MQPAIIVDLDSTLCNTEHRLHLIQGEKKYWPEFNGKCAEDTPNEWCVELVKAFFARQVRVVFITGRSMDYFDHTNAWIQRHVGIGEYDLYMRPYKNFKPDTEIKKTLYLECVKPRYKVLFCVDDRDSVVEMWREEGLTCLACAKGDY